MPLVAVDFARQLRRDKALDGIENGERGDKRHPKR